MASLRSCEGNAGNNLSGQPAALVALQRRRRELSDHRHGRAPILSPAADHPNGPLHRRNAGRQLNQTISCRARPCSRWPSSLSTRRRAPHRRSWALAQPIGLTDDYQRFNRLIIRLVDGDLPPDTRSRRCSACQSRLVAVNMTKHGHVSELACPAPRCEGVPSSHPSRERRAEPPVNPRLLRRRVRA